MKKTIAILIVLALAVSATFVLGLPSAAVEGPFASTVTLKKGNEAVGTLNADKAEYKGEKGTATFDASTATLTLDGLEGVGGIMWDGGNLTVVVKGATKLAGGDGSSNYFALAIANDKGNPTGKPGDLTVRLEKGAVLEISRQAAANYAIYNCGGSVFVEGEGTMTITNAAQGAIYAAPASKTPGPVTISIKDATVNLNSTHFGSLFTNRGTEQTIEISGKANVSIKETSFAHAEAGSIRFGNSNGDKYTAFLSVKDEAALTVDSKCAGIQGCSKDVSSSHTVVVSGSAKLDIKNSTNGMFTYVDSSFTVDESATLTINGSTAATNIAVSLKAGQYSALTVKTGENAEAAAKISGNIDAVELNKVKYVNVVSAPYALATEITLRGDNGSTVLATLNAKTISYNATKGTVTFDPATATVTLDGVSGVGAIRTDVGSFTVVVKGENTLQNSGNNVVAIGRQSLGQNGKAGNGGDITIRFEPGAVLNLTGTASTKNYTIYNNNGSVYIEGSGTLNITAAAGAIHTAANPADATCTWLSIQDTKVNITSSAQGSFSMASLTPDEILTIGGNAVVTINSTCNHATNGAIRGGTGAKHQDVKVVLNDNTTLTATAAKCPLFEGIDGNITLAVTLNNNAKLDATAACLLSVPKESAASLTVNDTASLVAKTSGTIGSATGGTYSASVNGGQLIKAGADEASAAKVEAVPDMTSADVHYLSIAPAKVFTVTVTAANATVTAEEGYSLEKVTECDDLKFTVKIADGYEAGPDFAVTANGEKLTAENGVYTVANVTGNVEIKVEGVVEVKAPDTDDTDKTDDTDTTTDTGSDTSTDTGSDSSSTNEGNPGTDASSVWMFGALAVVSAMVLAAAAALALRKKTND